MSERREVYLEQVPPYQVIYLGFTPDTIIDVAVSKFVEKYGTEPAEVFRRKTVLLVGPVPNPNQMRLGE